MSKERFKNDFQLVSLFLNIPGSRCPVYMLIFSDAFAKLDGGAGRKDLDRDYTLR